MEDIEADLALVGGGLANGILACWLRHRRPEVKFVLIEAGERLGGEHNWSFHGSDFDADARQLLEPMVRASWTGQEVVFPGFKRRLSTSYHAIGSDGFHDYLTQLLRERAVFAAAREVGEASVRLADGRRVRAGCVIDGRGWPGDLAGKFALGYQKFVGLEVETAAPHGVKAPVIMDSLVAQYDDFRFFYLLPFSETRLLIEDTYYSDAAGLDKEGIAARINAYARERGWQITRVARREHGVLPIVLAGEVAPFLAGEGEPARSGVRAGLFHPLTGYSLADAIRLADRVASLDALTTAGVRRAINALASELWDERAYYRLLNRLLFAGAQGDERRTVMGRFYTLSEGLIERLYAGRSTRFDKLRILAGIPPIPIRRALPVLPPSAGWAHAAAAQARQPLPR